MATCAAEQADALHLSASGTKLTQQYLGAAAGADVPGARRHALPTGGLRAAGRHGAERAQRAGRLRLLQVHRGGASR